jgi:glycosyltransferase involved in cell wall biosynthesis
MKVAILAGDRPSYVRPLAEGLFRMLEACGAEPVIHYEELTHLGLWQSVDTTSLRSIAGSTLRLIPSRRAFNEFLERVSDADLIIVVLHVPASFAKTVYPNIETLRERMPNVPIVNYDMVFLPTFLAFTESFGLPICELQACGCRIYMPDPHWASSHWISENGYGPREPKYSSNFVVYENDAELLAERIREEARTFDPAAVRATFERVQPQLLHGDRAALSDFLARVEDGTIHSRLHKSHVGVSG